MHSTAVEKEELKHNSYFVREDKKRDEFLNASYEKVFEMQVFEFLIESLFASAIEAFKTHSPALIGNMVLLDVQVIKEKLVNKIKVSRGFASLIDEVTDISKVQNLVLLIRYYEAEKSKTATDFAHKCDLLVESETVSVLSIFTSLKNALETELGFRFKEIGSILFMIEQK